MPEIDTSCEVRRLPVERTLARRRAVLRPHLPDCDSGLGLDHGLPTTVALGAVTAEDLVIAVAVLTPEPAPFTTTAGYGGSWRLRGTATSPDHRNRGIGSAVMRALIAHVAQAGGGPLWCNARVPVQCQGACGQLLRAFRPDTRGTRVG